LARVPDDRRSRSPARALLAEPVGTVTRLSFALEAELSGIQRLLLAGAVQKTMNAEVRTLDNLKRLLES
jgi:hypothetical protein